MKKALFALILVAAAFAGGAVMNGPGLDRLKAVLRSRLAPGPEPAASSRLGPPREIPEAPPPPLTLPTVARAGPTAATPVPDGPPKATIPVVAPPPRSEAPPLDLAGPEPTPMPGPTPSRTIEVDPAVAPASRGPASGLDWADLRRRMVALGVSRYEIEGEPGGRARFRCLIPLAGRRAVGQQFEGEGDDDLLAADAALRRVALWRATERTSP